MILEQGCQPGTVYRVPLEMELNGPRLHCKVRTLAVCPNCYSDLQIHLDTLLAFAELHRVYCPVCHFTSRFALEGDETVRVTAEGPCFGPVLNTT